MAEIMKNNFSNKKFYKQMTLFHNNLFILKNWIWLSSRKSFSKENELSLIEIVLVLRIW